MGQVGCSRATGREITLEGDNAAHSLELSGTKWDIRFLLPNRRIDELEAGKGTRRDRRLADMWRLNMA